MNGFKCDRCRMEAKKTDANKLCEIFIHPRSNKARLVMLCLDCQRILLKEIEDPGEVKS